MESERRRSVNEPEILASKPAADAVVRGIRRASRRLYSAEGKIRIVLAGLRHCTTAPQSQTAYGRIDDDTRKQIVELALEQPTLSPRELAVTFRDTKNYFVSEASVYRLLKAHDLFTSLAFIVV